MTRRVGSGCRGKEFTKVMVKGSLVLVSVQYYEHADALIAGHMMMMVAGNDTRKGDVINRRG